MAKFKKDGKRETPAISTASLPDIVFMLLFFFMVSTTMREVSLMVANAMPQATETVKLEKKSLVSNIYVGKPTPQYQGAYGTEPRIQLNDRFATLEELGAFVVSERESRKEEDRNSITNNLKVDKNVTMGVVTDIKQEFGFPTGLKWQITRKVQAPQKYVVCNADEGDPGAFMDRSILEGDPHSIVEAMAINGYCTGASKGLVYIRAEYPLAVERLKIAIRQAKEYGLLGENIFGTDFSFDIEIRYGAGAFVCGEETALIHSMEGLRGEATVKPPFPSEHGYKGCPTNVNNVETYANIPVILLRGAKWFSSIGTEKSKGTKVFALAGKVNNVGLIEVPMGTTLREVIFGIGGGIKDGKKFKAVQTGGPSGGCLTEKHLDLPIDYDNLLAAGSMMGSGGMIVMDEDDCMVAMAKFYLDFTVEESCGKCAPCRIGNKRLHEILQKITSGNGTEEDLTRLRNLAMVIKDTALCGLGQTSPNPVLSTMDNFYDEYLAHVREHRCPSHQCRELTQYFINPEKCKGCTLCARVCPVHAITGGRKIPHIIDPQACIRCGTCMEKCKFGAIYVH